MKTFKKFVESAKKIQEARVDYGNRLEFDTIGGKPEVSIIGNEVHLGCWSSGAKVFTGAEFDKKQAEADGKGEHYKFQQEVEQYLTKEILKAMDRFDKDVEAALKKYGLKKN